MRIFFPLGGVAFSCAYVHVPLLSYVLPLKTS